MSEALQQLVAELNSGALKVVDLTQLLGPDTPVALQLLEIAAAPAQRQRLDFAAHRHLTVGLRLVDRRERGHGDRRHERGHDGLDVGVLESPLDDALRDLRDGLSDGSPSSEDAS